MRCYRNSSVNGKRADSHTRVPKLDKYFIICQPTHVVFEILLTLPYRPVLQSLNVVLISLPIHKLLNLDPCYQLRQHRPFTQNLKKPNI